MMMLKRFFAMVAMLTLAGLSACGGGGGDSGNSQFGGGSINPGASPAVADLVVQLSDTTISNTGVGTVTATITALDGNRNSVSGAALTVAANTGAIVTIAGTLGSVTNASGQIVAQIGIGSDSTNRDITISANSGTITRSAVLKVVDSPAGATPKSIEVLAAATTAGTGGDGVLISVFVKDANNNALPSATVSFKTDTGTMSSVSKFTNAAGLATAVFSAGAEKSNRIATITVSSGIEKTDLKLPVTGTRLSLSGPSSLIIKNKATFDIVVTDSKGNVVPGLSISGTSALGNGLVVSGGATVTNGSGQISFTYTADKAGTDALVFSGGGATVSPVPAMVVSGEDFSFTSPEAGTKVDVGVDEEVTVTLLVGGVGKPETQINFAATGGTLSEASVKTDSKGKAKVKVNSSSAGPVTVQATVEGSATSATLPLVVVAKDPSRLVLQVNPTAIAPNASSASGNQAQVVAKLTDLAGNPVQGQIVNFTRVADPSGGNLLQASATTDASGQASVAYRSGSESTANNGVVLRGTVATKPTVTGDATLTVNQTALFIALGTGNVISNLDPQTYRKDWVVYVTDSNGIPVNGVTLTIKAIPTNYRTGRLRFLDPVWTYVSPIWSCRNEDANTNGTLDTGEDDNFDGVLWPGNVISVTPGNVQTVDGRATISLIYAESYVPWVEVKLTASATVTGTESKTSVEFIVTGLAADFSSATVSPAGVISPFGLAPAPTQVPGTCKLVQ